MGTMRIRLYATFRLIAGIKGLDLDLPDGTTVHQVILAALEQAPILRPHWLDEQGELHAHVHILADGEDVTSLPEGYDTPLKTDAILDIFPPVVGG